MLTPGLMETLIKRGKFRITSDSSVHIRFFGKTSKCCDAFFSGHGPLKTFVRFRTIAGTPDVFKSRAWEEVTYSWELGNEKVAECSLISLRTMFDGYRRNAKPEP